MMTYLKHVGNFKHSDLKTKKFEEIQALYEKKVKKGQMLNFISIGYAEDERLIKEINEKGIDSSKNESVKEEDKEEEGTKNRKGGHIKMGEIMEKKSVIARLNKVSSPDGDFLVIYRANGNFRAFNYLMEKENEQSDFWSGQQDWKIVTWRLYESCRVCILEFEDGIVQDQTVLGKDYSNLLIADSLLKTIWFINAPCYDNEALASPKANELTIPEQTSTGKGASNPFMAGSLPKTTKPT
ncbi:hypothetical protein Tco_0768311 [Tanacetum coccineum]